MLSETWSEPPRQPASPVFTFGHLRRTQQWLCRRYSTASSAPNQDEYCVFVFEWRHGQTVGNKARSLRSDWNVHNLLHDSIFTFAFVHNSWNGNVWQQNIRIIRNLPLSIFHCWWMFDVISFLSRLFIFCISVFYSCAVYLHNKSHHFMAYMGFIKNIYLNTKKKLGVSERFTKNRTFCFASSLLRKLQQEVHAFRI